MMYKVAIDVGGTFTDFVAIDENGRLLYYKDLTTPKNPEVGIRKGLASLNLKLHEVIHATTIATNSLLGQIGLELPKVALLTTKGFRDVIEIGRQNRPRLYDLYFEKPRQLVPRDLRFEVNERVNAEGKVLVPLDVNEVIEVVNKMKEKGVEAISISFLHSYINPINEKLARDIVKKHFRYISVSHEVAPEPREYERTSTTIINSALMPIVSRYIESLVETLKDFGSPRLFIMSSSGGLVDETEAIERPVQLIESGPAAGVIGTAALSRILGIRKAISFDMGGTTAKAGTVVDYEILITTEYEVGGEVHHGRIVKGSGYPIKFPFVDLAEVSAGGGSIIWRDKAGALNVGPLSAGADPGPISYNKGGDKPTLTDANLVLGRIGEELVGGKLILNKQLAMKGLSSLGDPIQVSNSAISIANLEMARAIRLVTVERGYDPSEFTLVTFGGAGPQHALDIAEELGIRNVIITPHPGLFSALGMLFADEKFEVRKSYPQKIPDDFRELEDKLVRRIGRVDYFIRYADVRYEGQGWELTVNVDEPSLERIKKEFENKHEAIYGFKLNRPIEVVTIRVFGIRVTKKPRLSTPKTEGEPKVRYRKVYFDEWIEVPIYWREELPLGLKIEGPAIIEEYSSTTVIKPKWKAEVIDFGILRIWR
ncbi:MAG: hydantoinase/oxoprolinase family protein [Sulfolobaceae archaeon]